MVIEPAEVEPLINLLPYQKAAVESDARFRWDCWARQTGKSFTTSLRRVLRGLSRGRTQVFPSAGERQSRELMAKARQHCETLKIATDYYDNRFFKNMSIKQLEIVLPGGQHRCLGRTCCRFSHYNTPSEAPTLHFPPTLWADHRFARQSANGTRLHRRCAARRVRHARRRP